MTETGSCLSWPEDDILRLSCGPVCEGWSANEVKGIGHLTRLAVRLANLECVAHLRWMVPYVCYM
jgi:hypothetical protein